MLKPAVAKLAYVQTLVSLYSACLLTPDEIDQLVSGGCSTEESQILSKAGLGHLVPERLKDGTCLYDGEKIDSLFLSEFINQSIRIARAFSGTEHELLIYWLRQIEISNIKTILRGKAMHRSNQLIEAELFDMGPYTSLPLDDLLQTEDVAEVLRHLEQTCYASLAHYTLQQYEQHNDIFSLETSVDQQFFIGLMRRFTMLKKSDQLQLHPLIGRVIDQMNLIRLLRYRVNYGLSPSHTYFLLSSGGYCLKRQELLNLAKLNDLEPLINELPAMLSRKVHIRLNGYKQSIQIVNSVMEREVIDFAHAYLTTNSFTLTSVFAFLIIRRQQLSLLHAVLKGRHMRQDEQTIRFSTGLN